LASATVKASRDAQDEISASLKTLAEGIVELTRAQRLALDSQLAQDTERARLASASIEHATALTADMEVLATRMADTLKVLSTDLDRGVDALVEARTKTLPPAEPKPEPGSAPTARSMLLSALSGGRR
jgi:hypothetical protein